MTILKELLSTDDNSHVFKRWIDSKSVYSDGIKRHEPQLLIEIDQLWDHLNIGFYCTHAEENEDSHVTNRYVIMGTIKQGDDILHVVLSCLGRWVHGSLNVIYDRYIYISKSLDFCEGVLFSFCESNYREFKETGKLSW